ncbi:pirin family protein [Arsenophonus sp.]|uniref:pirin family protein n=1 Tax=Arsenophonus sp. TaxID=1872640 RepID=UPI00286752BB|nr:pirin family protein [Arsenophonus sp.]MDR5616589.1 pirin family protein [Arsenophonus sp.]
MIIPRIQKQCGHADFGWLQAQYTFSFGHYFDPDFTHHGALRVLNRETIAPKAACQAKTYPNIDIINLVLHGDAEFHDSEGNRIHQSENECLLLSPIPHISYSEHNVSHEKPLIQLQLWINACVEYFCHPPQKRKLANNDALTLLASPNGSENSLKIRQQTWISHIYLKTEQSMTLSLKGKNSYLYSITGIVKLANNNHKIAYIHCSDGAFLMQEQKVKLTAQTDFRGILIYLN